MITKKLIFLFLFFFSFNEVIAQCASVNANFTLNQNSFCGNGPHAVILTNTTAGASLTGLTFNWYADGNLINSTTNVATPVTYNLSGYGNHVFTLTVIDPSVPCTESVNQNVGVYTVPSASFSFPGIGYCTNNVIPFTSTSSGTNASTTYLWNFGNGATSTLQNPNYAFPNAGTYNVTLTTTNGPNCSTTSTQVITITAGPNINISGDDGTGDITYCLFPADNTSSETVAFSNSTTNAINYVWNFGDGSPLFNTTSTATFNHVYTSYGTYTVTMTATSANGCQDTDTLTVIFEKYVSSGLTLDITEYSGCIPHAITTLTNLSVNATTFTWNFGDGTTVTTNSSIPPNHNYILGGTYTITLTAANSCNSSNATISPITIISSPVVNFTPSLFTGCAPQTVTFTNTSTNAQPPNNYQWNMGNGNTYTNVVNPGSQVYSNAGTYTIQLIAGNGCGYDTMVQTIVIDTVPTVDMILIPSEGCTPLTVNPVATLLSGLTVGWSWDINLNFYSLNPFDIPNQTFASVHPSDTTIRTIQVAVYNVCGSGVDKDSVIIHPPVVANFTSPNTVCTNRNVNFVNHSLGTQRQYIWDFGDGSATSTNTNPSHVYSTAGTYTVTLTTTGFCGTSIFTKNIVVLNEPVISISANPAVICNGESVTFTNTSTNGSAYFWNFGPHANLLSSNLHTPPAISFYGSLTTEKVYFTVSNSGCAVTDSLEIILSNSPTANFSISPNLGCGTVHSNFTNSTVDQPGHIYTWDFGNGNTSSLYNPPNQTYTSLAVDTVYEVLLIVENAGGCRDSATQTVTVFSLPVANYSLVEDSLCFGEDANFLNSSLNATNYEWAYGDGTLSTIVSPVYNYIDAGTFQVQLVAYSTNGCTDTMVSVIQVDSVPDPAYTATTVCMGNPTDFFLSTINGLTTYSWDFGDGSSAFVGTNPQYTYATSGTFPVTIMAANLFNCVSTFTTNITVEEIPISNFNWSQTCLGSAMNFTNLTTGIISSQQWDFGDGNFSSGFSPSTTYLDTGSYTVKLVSTNTLGCSDSTFIQVYVDSIPTADFYFTSMCTGDTTQFTNTSFSSPANYSWDFDDGTNSTSPSPSHIYTLPNSYSVTLVSTYPTNGCAAQITHIVDAYPRTFPNFSSTNYCLGDQTSFTDLTSNSPTSWEWIFGDGSPSLFVQSPSHVFPMAGTFAVNLVTTNIFGCSDTTVQQIVINGLPVAAFNSNVVCQGANTNFTNTSVNHTNSEWNFGDGSPFNSSNSPSYTYSSDGTFLVELVVSSGVGCFDTIQQNVTVNPNPTAAYIADSVCFELFNSFTDGSSNAISWLYDFGDGTIGTSQNESHLYAAPGTYLTEQLVTNIFGCQDSVTQTVVVYNLPIANFSAATVCEDDSTNFTDQSAGTVQNWSWDFDDAGTTSIQQNPSHIYSVGGNFNVELLVTDDHNCVDDTLIVISTVSKPTVEFSFDTVCHTSTTLFTDLSSDPIGIASWLYQFGENSNQSSAQNPTYIYQNPGNYTVMYTATNNFGCFDTISHHVIVEEVPVAEFSYDTVCFGNTTNFTNLSTGPISSSSWDFGDGSPIFSGLNPQHAYTSAGQYVVTLTDSSAFGCAHVSTHTVLVLSSPANDFIWTQTCLGSAMNFTNQTLGLPNTYLWNFGDGSQSSAVHPTHTYADTGSFLVQLNSTNSLGCSDSISILVYVDSVPTADFIVTSMCSNDVTQFTNTSVSAPANYVWSFGDGVGSFLFEPNHIYLNPGSYTASLEVTYSTNGCSNSMSQTVDAYPHTIPNFSSANYCFEDQTTFTDLSSNAAISWVWSFGDGSGPNFSQSPTHVFLNSGIFNVSLVTTNSYGCSDTMVQQIEIFTLPVPAFTTTPECLGAATVFTNNSSNFTSSEWNFGDGSPFDLNISPTHLYSVDGTFNVALALANQHGCRDTLFQNVFVHPNPQATYSIDSVCFGFANTLTDFSSNAVSWIYDFGDGNFGTNPNETHVYNSAGTFITEQLVTNAFGCQDSLSQTVVVYSLPIADFDAATVCEDAVSNFIDQSSGNLVGWNWDFDDNGATSNVSNPTHVYNTGGNFSVSLNVIDQHGCVDDTLLLVTTISKPTVNFTFDTVCHLTPTHFFDLSTDPLGISSWTYNFGDFNQSGAQNPSHIYQNSGNYTVTFIAGNSFGCVDSVVQTIAVIDIPNPDFTFDTVCVGTATNFTDLSTGVINTWDWDFGDGTTSTSAGNVSHTFTSSGNYLVKLELNGAQQCPEDIIHSVLVYNGITPVIGAPATACENGIVQFNDITPPNPNTITTWFWDFGDGLTSNLANPTHTFTAFGNYYVTLTLTTSTGCTGTSGFNIMILEPPSIQINTNIACEDQITDLYAITNMIIGSWTWNFGDGSQVSNLQSPSHVYLSAGNYNVILNVIANNGCVGNASQQITISPSPIANFTFTTVCPGDPVDFTNTSSGVISSYEWIYSGSVFSSTTNTTYTFPSNNTPQEISLVAINTIGCRDTAMQTIQSHPNVNFDYGPTLASGCEDFFASFVDNSTTLGGGIVNWVWDFGDGYNAFSANPSHLYQNAGNYPIALAVTTAENCQFFDTLSYQVIVFPAPTANFMYPPDEYNLNNPQVQFTDLSQGALNWQWDFGDDNFSSEINPIHSYTDTGVFYVTQIVLNQYGCRDTAYSDVHIHSSTLVYVPNAFTPDGNEHNNYFTIKGIGIKRFTLQVYDRWGELLFQTSDPDGGWDGVYKGRACKEDIYIWKLEYYDYQNESHKKYGHVTLLRE